MATAKYKKNKRGEFEARIWDGTYNPDGSKHRKKLVSKKSSADLERIVNDFRKQVEDMGDVRYSNISFGEYKEQWLSVAKSSREKNTILMYRNILSLLSFMDDLRMADIRHAHFQQAINENAEHPRTCQQIYLTLRQIIKMAVRDRILPRNAIDDLAADISLPSYQKPQRRALTAREKDAILSVELDPRKMAFLFLLYSCGLRRGEALALSRFDFDWSNNTVSITKTLIFAPHPEIKPYPKSKNGIRVVPIPSSAIPKIKPFVESSDGGCLFRTQHGDLMTATGYNRLWRSILVSVNRTLGSGQNAHHRANGEPTHGLTAHVLRHNYCTELCYQIPSISTKMIARLMGDTEKMVLDVYSHIVEEKEAVSASLEAAFGT
ncbi:MAG: site-specific integrase [Lachnospiraceae bacterium]|nr:site-specific integrase [Lachnospiraceae bacterium]